MKILDSLRQYATGSKRVGGVMGMSKGKGKYPDAELVPQTDEEKRRVGILQSMLDEGRQCREPWEAQMKAGFEYLVGRQYPPRMKAHKANPKYNYLWRNTEAMVSRLTNSNPRINLVPTEPTSVDNIRGMEKLCDQWWDALSMRQKFINNTRSCLVMGKSFYYTYWDHDAGQPCTELVSAKCIYVNRGATSLDDCTWLAHVTKMPIWKVYQYWPKSKGKIEPGLETTDEPMKELSEMAPPDPTDQTPVVFDMKDATTTYRSYSRPDYFGDQLEDTDMVQVVQFWIRDPARTTEPMNWDDGLPAMFPDGGQMHLEKPMYPGGRLVVLAGQRIVHDAPNPFEHGEFPYVEQNCYGIPDEFWNMSFVYNQISPQKELNKTMAQIVENKNQISQPRVLADRGSGFDPNMDTGVPGQTWWKNPGTDVKVIEMPSMPPYVMNLVEFGVGAMKELSGVTDSSVGVKDPGIQSGVAIQTLAAQSRTQSGTLEANCEEAIRRLGNQWIGLARQFVTESQYIQTTDDQGKPTFQEITPDMIRKEWGVRVGAGSTLPVDRATLMQQAMEMFQVGIFDEEAVLEYSRMPNAEALLKRIQQKKQMEQQMQQMAGQIQQKAQGPRGGGGGGGEDVGA